jgi:hypothetical protein
MSKISYCSLEEAWGDSFIQKDEKKNIINKIDKIERENVISNMDSVERKKTCENNSIVEYNKYRINSSNNVSNNNVEKEYSPFNESIEKKYLQDKLHFLENEFTRYKHLFEKIDSESNQKKDNIVERFGNENSSDSSDSSNNSNNKNFKSNDIIDLILLIIIGLIVILVMNSIFSIGKKIGARNNN